MIKIPLWKDLSMTLNGILRYNFFLIKSQFWKKEKINEYQFIKLRELLIESYENVPYYKELFYNINFDPNVDFLSLDDMKKIPILTKNEAKKNKHKLINPKFTNYSFPMRTSGSTGEPFEVAVYTRAWEVEQAVIWRHWKWGGYNFRDEMAIIRSYSPKKGEPLIKSDSIRKFTYYSPFHLNEENLDLYINTIIKRKTKIIRGYPSSILTLAQYVKKHEITIPTLKLILTASEVLSDVDREFIESSLKTKISNHYGLAEVCVMMGDCEKHELMHNYDEYGYLELLNTDNEKLKKIIGTNLHNKAMPLIRYETGDLAEIANTHCSCARNLIGIKNIIGRSDTNILTPEGFKIPTVNFYTLFESYQRINRWQIIQHKINFLEVIISTEELTQNEIGNIKKDLRQRIPESVEVLLSINKAFLKINEGKQNVFLTFIK